VALEEGYGAISLTAIERLLPGLREGLPYATVRRQVFPDQFEATDSLDELPPVHKAVENLRNPGVHRALTEVRKLVNAIVREHGKPASIRIELARDLKNPRSMRERISREMRDREGTRERIKARLLDDAGIRTPSRDDILKVLLADECNWLCPYTGRQIEWRSLFGPTPQFDIEHIWPRSRSLDDSFVNKTLCYHEENRSRKHGRTPWEAYSSDTTRWAEIIQRVHSFQGDIRTFREKLRRFEAQELDADAFTNRHLSDTRYIAGAAADYLALLYGGRVDAEHQRRVEPRTGGLTAWLRNGWGLNTILAPDNEPGKNREDHRHHAVDAIVIALTDERAVQILSRAAARADDLWQPRAFNSIDEPWAGFREQAQAAVEGIVVSHRQGRKVAGPLHDQTLYSKPHGDKHRVRKQLSKLTAADILKERIVDKRALRAIREKLAELGKPDLSDRDIAKLFDDPANAPMMRGNNGKPVRLRKVRVEVDRSPVPIGHDATLRNVSTGSNHHTVVWEVSDAKGQVRWEHKPVTLMEAYRRKSRREPIVYRDGGPGRQFLFSLAKGEHIEMADPKHPDVRRVYRILSISEGDIEVVRTDDARTSTDRRSDRTRITGQGDRLRTLGAKKVLVTYLGDIRRAAD
jgi:CRISPR-associated endonuclease Csn1